ncbi:hypothetical protein [Actinomyces vulturis]|uniref:hypothetical protein n=1 Tax=Actinomyces vulturis TaxID=1857645 RepID=UPI00082981C4|nr:hypothetical protein [Actinomyces vulturis]
MVRHASHIELYPADAFRSDPINRPDFWPWGTDSDNGELLVGGMRVPQILSALGDAHTPVLVCDADDLSSRMCTWASALAEECWPSYGMNDATVLYDLSTMGAPAVARLALSQGLGLKARSLGELSLGFSLINQHCASLKHATSPVPVKRPHLILDAPVLFPNLVQAALEAHALVTIRSMADLDVLISVLRIRPAQTPPHARVIIALQTDNDGYEDDSSRSDDASSTNRRATEVTYLPALTMTEFREAIRICRKQAEVDSLLVAIEGISLTFTDEAPSAIAQVLGHVIDQWPIAESPAHPDHGGASLSLLDITLDPPVAHTDPHYAINGAAHYARAWVPVLRERCQARHLSIPHLIVDPSWAGVGASTMVLSRVLRVDHGESALTASTTDLNNESIDDLSANVPTVWIDTPLTRDLLTISGSTPLTATYAWNAHGSANNNAHATPANDDEHSASATQQEYLLRSASHADSAHTALRVILPVDLQANDILAMPIIGAMMLGRYATASFETAPGLAMIHHGQATWAVRPQTVEAVISRFL